MITESIIVLSGLGLGFGLFLAYASKKFHVKTDPRVNDVLGVLPGANCGACGYAGCAAYAEAVVLNEDVPVSLCIPGQKAVADKVGAILGRTSEVKEGKKAQLHCDGGKDECPSKYNYKGVETCKAASIVAGGPKSCSFGCIGFGDCMRACPFDAIRMGNNSLPIINKEKCTGCGKCVETCPKMIISLAPIKSKVHVRCSSKDNAKDVMKVCKVGCIGCKMCEKACPADAIHVIDNIAKIDYSKCISCGKCVTVCPRKIIERVA